MPRQSHREIRIGENSHLCVFSLLDRLLHGLERVLGELCRYNELPVNVLDFLHHVRLELSEGFL